MAGRSIPSAAGRCSGVDHDGLGVQVGRGVLLARDRERLSLGGLVGLEPFVQPSVRDLQARASADGASGLVSASQAGPRISTISWSGSRRDW